MSGNLWAAGVVSLAALLGFEAPAPAGPVPGDRKAALETVAHDLARDGFSGTILVARGQEILLHRAFGLADRERSVPNTPRTVYEIGSITKRFTLAGILLLEEQGRLRTADPVAKYLEGVPADKSGVTLDHLLNHTSGLPEYHDTEGDFEEMSREQALETILSQELGFEPGDRMSYSNPGYTLLAAVIENASGLPYPVFVHRRLLRPAGLKRSGFYQDTIWKPEDVAVGYGGRTHGDPNSPRGWPEIGWALMGNGGMVSSPEDLHRWLQALAGGRILGKEALARLYRRDIDAGPEDGRLPMIVYAGGNDFGFQAVVAEMFDDNAVVIAASHDASGLRAGDAVRALIAAMGEGKAPRLERQIAVGNGAEPPSPPPGSPAERWGVPGSPRGLMAGRILDLLAAGTPEARDVFIETGFAPGFRDRFPMEMHRSVLGDFMREVPDPEVVTLEKTGPWSARMEIRSRRSGARFRVEYEVEPGEPHRIVGMMVAPADGGG